MRALSVIAEEIASGYIHDLLPILRAHARLVCPSDEAEQAVIEAITRASLATAISVEVIDLRPAPAGRLTAVTERLRGWGGEIHNGARSSPTLLILSGFDVFGDELNEGPTYPFRSDFQFDREFLWLFIGRDAARMRFLFDSYRRPLYRAAGDITPKDWRATARRT